MKKHIIKVRPESSGKLFFKLSIAVVLFFMSGISYALSIKDSVVYGRNVYVIDWLDNYGKPRKFCLVKDSHQDYVGITQYMQYYDGNTKVTVTTPFIDGGAINGGFGTTVHHVNPTPNQHRATSGHVLSLVFQGPHHAVFNWTQTIGGAVITVTYTFMDGQDYFQWQNTTDATNGTLNGDSRGPYCTMNWDGVDFSQVEGQEYAAKRYFSQPSYNGAWTLDGNVDIPYVRQWDNNREIGYVQTQTFDQQLAGNPTWGGSLNLGTSGSTVADEDVWKFDYQMNFYDKAKKITWGLPYGWLKGDASAGTKNKWGQYSLSVILDGKNTGGVLRVRDENRAIHNGSVILTAVAGSVVTAGPVGTVNPATQTLSPAGYDHNYRTWWVVADGTGNLDLNMNVNGGSVLQNPTFRVKGMTGLPSSVKFNNTTLVAGTDFYASYYASKSEVWITVKRNFTGSVNLKVADANNTGLIINSASANPSSISNASTTEVNFTVNATDDGSITSVKLNLSALGGPSSVDMSAGSSNNYLYSYNVTSGLATGTKTVSVTVTDNNGNTKTAEITIQVSSPRSVIDIYTDASTKIVDKWAGGGTLTEKSGSAYEGNKYYEFTYTASGWWAGFGWNFDNWGGSAPVNAAGYDSLLIAYSSSNGASVVVQLVGDGNVASGTVTLPASETYSKVKIALSEFGSIDLSKITGLNISASPTTETGSGLIKVDDVTLVKLNVVSSTPTISEDMISLYPNPFSGMLQLDLSKMPSEQYQIHLINSLGATVLSMTGQGSYLQLITDNLPAGTYTLMLKSASGVLSRKMIKL
ncbi:MAG: T9SS type A sorting domain-containing protein [Cytophagaceae bacterium]